MKKLTLLLVIVMTFACGSLFAQDDYPRAEIFGGFSLLNTDLSGVWNERYSFYGFQASGVFNLDEFFGVEADFGGQYKSEGGETVHFYEYMFGPRFAVRREKASFFVHALFGGMNLGVSGDSVSGFALGIGGGVDLNVNDRFAVRIVQFDWIPSRFTREDEIFWVKDTVRFGFGIVIK